MVYHNWFFPVHFLFVFLLIEILFLSLKPKWLKKALNLSSNVFSTKALIGDTIFTSQTGYETTILRGQPSQAKVLPLVVQREYLHFSVILRPWVLVRSREPNPRYPAVQSTMYRLSKTCRGCSKFRLIRLQFYNHNQCLNQFKLASHCYFQIT